MTNNVTDTNVGKMTEEEAIEIIDISPAYIGLEKISKGCSYDEWSQAVNMAIEALQKQIPTLPIYSCPDFMCPKCMTYGIEDLDREKLDYCPNCGQAIDWRDKE